MNYSDSPKTETDIDNPDAKELAGIVSKFKWHIEHQDDFDCWGVFIWVVGQCSPLQFTPGCAPDPCAKLMAALFDLSLSKRVTKAVIESYGSFDGTYDYTYLHLMMASTADGSTNVDSDVLDAFKFLG